MMVIVSVEEGRYEEVDDAVGRAGEGLACRELAGVPPSYIYNCLFVDCLSSKEVKITRKRNFL